MAELMYVLAGGQHIDTDRMKRFVDQLDELYANPFSLVKMSKDMSAQEIKDHIREKIRKRRKELGG
jgi:hypothetical protein